MSQENMETIARLYDEFLARPERVSDPGMLPDVLQFFDPGVEIRQASSFLGTEGTFHGYDGLAHSAREALETFRDLHWVPIRLMESGDHVVATVEARGYGRHSDVEVNETVAHVWTLRGGRIVAWHVYMDGADALEAVELSE
jgi:ketosteroid isomerase-like protein